MTTGSIKNNPIAGATADAAPELAVTVREIIEEARRVAGSGTRLAERLQELGIRPADTTRYSESAISNWIRGRTMPPADVLVAASLIAGLPLVTPRGAAAGEHGRQVLELGADLQAQVDALRAAIIDLYGRLGYPLPNLDSSHDSDQKDRPAASTG
jgi:transcriptional regulator with XRE-family HTH domain